MVLFRAFVEVDKHVTKKNSKNAYYNKATGRAWVTRSNDAIKAQNYLEAQLASQRNRQLQGQTITGEIQVTLIFKFKDFYTAKMRRNRKIPDLDNLLCLPLDALVKAKIIEDDCDVMSLDGSRRLPGDKNMLEILITDFREE